MPAYQYVVNIYYSNASFVNIGCTTYKEAINKIAELETDANYGHIQRIVLMIIRI